MQYFYSISTHVTSGQFDARVLHETISHDTNITKELIGVTQSGDSIKISFAVSLDNAEKAVLDGIVAGHQGDTLQIYKTKIENAIAFFNEILIVYTAENVALQITQSGKTKDVADYLANVLRYGQSGSLYQVMTEIDDLIAAGLPPELSPFVTVDRLNEFKGKIVEYLT